jgi:LacI family transcriptional regulator
MKWVGALSLELCISGGAAEVADRLSATFVDKVFVNGAPLIDNGEPRIELENPLIKKTARKSAKRAAGGRPRLIDVARLAGVSLGSASHALSNPEAVKAKTLQAVRAAVAQLAYVPDGTARSLALRRSFTVGAILPTVNNPVYADFVHALQQTLGHAKYGLLVSAHEYDRDGEVAITERLLQRGVDGIVLVGTDHDPRVIAQIERAAVPYLFTWSTDEAAGRNCVGFSNRRAMQQLVKYLVKLGHRHVAVLSGQVQTNERARARLEGIADTLELAGHSLAPQNVFYGQFSVDFGRDGLRRALALDPKPTALICSTDLVAAGAIAEAAALGVKVPDELSITGFDNIVYSSLLSPALTTVDVPTLEMGRKAGEAVLRAIEGAPSEPCSLTTKLVIRDSTARPRRR